jgi:hypothetical protein
LSYFLSSLALFQLLVEIIDLRDSLGKLLNCRGFVKAVRGPTLRAEFMSEGHSVITTLTLVKVD